MKEAIKSKPRTYRVVINFTVNSETAKGGKELAKKALKTMNLDVVSLRYISDKRTENQNNAAHLWFDQIATEAEKRGLTVDKWLQKPQEMFITESLLKDSFRALGKAMFKKDSTAKLTKEEFSFTVDVFDKAILERLGIDIPFPNLQLLIDQDELNQLKNQKNV